MAIVVVVCYRTGLAAVAAVESEWLSPLLFLLTAVLPRGQDAYYY